MCGVILSLDVVGSALIHSTVKHQASITKNQILHWELLVNHKSSEDYGIDKVLGTSADNKVAL